jgi:hypothetical protein
MVRLSRPLLCGDGWITERGQWNFFEVAYGQADKGLLEERK